MSKPTITSVELNYIVFRYLQESGFIHAAFTLGYEAGIHKCEIDGKLVPPGALITVVQKGLQYIELEANMNENDMDVDEDFSLLQSLDLITKDLNDLQEIIKKKKREKLLMEPDKDKGKDKESVDEHERHHGGERERERHNKDRGQERNKEKAEANKEQEKDKEKEKQKDKEKEKQHSERIDKAKLDEDGVGGAAEPMDVILNSHPVALEISSSDVTILEGHSSEVFACAWSPAGSLLASGWALM